MLKPSKMHRSFLGLKNKPHHICVGTFLNAASPIDYSFIDYLRKLFPAMRALLTSLQINIFFFQPGILECALVWH